MSEKVLGFKLEDSTLAVELKDTSFERDVRVIDICKLVSVRLASESVSIEWLEKWCKENVFKMSVKKSLATFEGEKHIETKSKEYISIPNLLKAVRLQAEKEAKKK